MHSERIDLEKKETPVGELSYGDEIKVITIHSPDRKKRIVYCHIFNIDTKKHRRKKLFQTTVEKKRGLFNLLSKRQTNLAISQDGSFIAIATDNDTKSVNSFTVRVYNSETLKMLYKKVYRKEEKKHFEHNDLVVDNQGTVYAMGKIYKEGKQERKRGEANYDFVVTQVSKDNKNDILVDIGDEHIKSLVFSLKDDVLQMYGFYSEKRAGRIKGGCSFTLDLEDFKIIDQTTTELPIEVFEDLYGERKAKRASKKELSRFYIDYVLHDLQDNTYLLAEEFYITRQVSVTPGVPDQTIYHYDDILVLMFDARGELAWGRSIFKRSTSPSYNAFVKDSKLHIILNSGKNLKEKKDGRTLAKRSMFQSTALYDFVYSSDGKVSNDKIQNNKGNSFYFPNVGYFNGYRFVMTSSKKRKRRFMILE